MAFMGVHMLLAFMVVTSVVTAAFSVFVKDPPAAVTLAKKAKASDHQTRLYQTPSN